MAEIIVRPKRCLVAANTGVAPHPVIVLCHRRLVGSVDDAVFLLGFLRDEGIDFLHPALHVLELLHQGAAGGELLRLASTRELLAYRGDRHVNVKLYLSQVADGPSVPRSKRKAVMSTALAWSGSCAALIPAVAPRYGPTGRNDRVSRK